jgi:hypothetical protein
MKKVVCYLFVLLLFISIFVIPRSVSSIRQGVSLGVDKYKDLYLLDHSSGVIHHIDSETGIYLGEFHSTETIEAESFTDISVCSCGGGIGLLDSVGDTIWVVDFTGQLLWKKDNTTPNLGFNDSLSLAICQDSNYEHLILGTQNGNAYHVSPPGETDGEFTKYPNISYGRISGVYMDFIKQVFIADTDNSRIVKTDEWGRVIAQCQQGILDKPVDVATTEDSNRRVWVADRGSGKLHVFDRYLDHLFDCGDSVLTDPLTVICDYLDGGCYTAEIVDSCVYLHKFDKDGVHLFTLTGATRLPEQILLSANPNSYVLDNRSGENQPLKNKPTLKDGRYFIEARPVFESMGFSVKWDESERSATIAKDDINIAIFPDKQAMVADGESRCINPPVFISRAKLQIPIDILEECFQITAEINSNTIFFIHPPLTNSQQLPEPDIGKHLFEETCGQCHTHPAPETKARDEWPPIVERMRMKGESDISKADAEKISRFLWGQGYPE